ncbi:MAG: hypothetical protein JW810_13010 [Sedimentisphaerales bacterium]|nr:hypothetical protein [Sedimentisphaerales bacterium]
MSMLRDLIHAYFERLGEQLSDNAAACRDRIEPLLARELARVDPAEPTDAERFAAYADAVRSFLDERIEMYNPIGIQYLFDRINRRQAAQIEMQLNWYDSRPEYEHLLQTARAILAERLGPQTNVSVGPDPVDSGGSDAEDLSEDRLVALAEELIDRCGAYPDASIIDGYEAAPAPRKLPDYILAVAIEEIVPLRKRLGRENDRPPTQRNDCP